MALANRPLGDTPDRSYAGKLERFARFLAPDLRRVFADLCVPAGATVLDLGCGPALTTELLVEQLGPSVHGVGADLSLPHLREGQHQRNLRWVQSDASNVEDFHHLQTLTVFEAR